MITEQVLACTGASGIHSEQVLQTLWSGYGSIVRLSLDYPANSAARAIPSVVVKHIQPPARPQHPRGWDTNASMQRKLESYRVEANWYNHYAANSRAVCAMPGLFASHSDGNQTWLLLEDLDIRFPQRHSRLDAQACKPCLRWLAKFHAHHLQSTGDGLWPTGTYWHLQTRQDEYQAMAEGELKEAADLLDQKLENCRYKTLVHGDAKVANICFPAASGDVAMVDFQYVGRGCGIRDVAYFLGSCLDESACEQYAGELVECYFSELRHALPSSTCGAVEAEWRDLYAIAWADFHRFLAGWMPGHQKINRYTERMTRLALSGL